MGNFLKSATLLLITIAVVVGVQSCKTTVKPVDQAQLDGYWVLKTIDGQDATALFAHSLPGMQFSFADSMLAGTGGCNRFFGKFTLTPENKFSAPQLGMTMMACDNMAQESKFMKTLSPAILNLSVSEEGGLILTDDHDKVLLEFVKGEGPLNAPGKSEIITTENVVGKWYLKMFQGQQLLEIKSNLPFIEFNSQESKVFGNAGCNNFNGVYTIAEGKVTFGPLMTTRMSCPELSRETELLGLFQNPIEGAIEDNVLVFYQNGKKVLEYTRSED